MEFSSKKRMCRKAHKQWLASRRTGNWKKCILFFSIFLCFYISIFILFLFLFFLVPHQTEINAKKYPVEYLINLSRLTDHSLVDQEWTDNFEMFKVWLLLIRKMRLHQLTSLSAMAVNTRLCNRRRISSPSRSNKKIFDRTSTLNCGHFFLIFSLSSFWM